MDVQDNLSLEGTGQEEQKQDQIIENTTDQVTISVPQTQEEVIARLKELAQSDKLAEKQELDTLKQVFYKIHKTEVNAARTAFIENGGKPEDFLPAPNVLEDEFKTAMNTIKQKKAEALAEQERIKEENLQ